jgi:hypothetical protein
MIYVYFYKVCNCYEKRVAGKEREAKRAPWRNSHHSLMVSLHSETVTKINGVLFLAICTIKHVRSGQGGEQAPLSRVVVCGSTSDRDDYIWFQLLYKIHSTLLAKVAV